MHIVFVNRWFPPETGGGGVATHNYNLAEALAAAGHRVSVIAHRPRPDVPPYIERDGIHIHRVSVADTGRLKRVPLIGQHYRFLQAVLYSRAACRALHTLSQSHPVDIAEFAEVNAESLFYRSRMSRALVVRCHTPTFVLERYYLPSEVPFGTRLFGWAERRVIRRATHLTAPSHDMAQVISADVPGSNAKLQVIPNAIADVPVSQSDEIRTDSGVTILFVGRFERVKGLDLVLAALPQVCELAPGARFVLVGLDRQKDATETYEQHIRRTMQEFMARGQLDLQGFVTASELDRLYHSADICLAPSLLYESFSMTCAQAMAYGKPVISTRIGGIPETIGTAGVLIEPTVGALTDAIVMLVNDRALRHALGQAARARVSEKFATAVVAEQSIQYYKALIPIPK